jgi:hypothetical protein
VGAAREERWRVADAVAWTASDKDIVVLDLDSPAAHPMTLEESAAYIWEELALSGPITADELVQKVAGAYGVGAEIVRDDILELLAQLRDQRLVTS